MKTDANQAPSIALVRGTVSTEKLPIDRDVYIGQKIEFNDTHSGDVAVRVGVWESGVAKTYIEDYPFTEFVLMISGRVVLTNEDGTSNELVAGDTFVMPKGWSGIWDVQEAMKKQIVQVGDPIAKPNTQPITN